MSAHRYTFSQRNWTLPLREALHMLPSCRTRLPVSTTPAQQPRSSGTPALQSVAKGLNMLVWTNASNHGHEQHSTLLGFHKFQHNVVQVPEQLRAAFLQAVDAGCVRSMQNKSMPAAPLHRPGALLLGAQMESQWQVYLSVVTPCSLTCMPGHVGGCCFGV